VASTAPIGSVADLAGGSIAGPSERGMLHRSQITDADEKAILLKEMDLLQKIFDKYDGWIFKLRAACLTSVPALSITLSAKHPELKTLAILIPFMGFFVEGMIRWDHWYGYVERYNVIRTFLNSKDGKLYLYDLKNYRNGGRRNFLEMFTRERIASSFCKQEVAVFYALLLIVCLFLRSMA